MADSLTRFYWGCPSTTSASLFTATAPSVIRNIHMTNASSADRTITLYLNATTGATNALYNVFTIPAYGVHIANVSIVLNNGDYIAGANGSANGVNVCISGVTSS